MSEEKVVPPKPPKKEVDWASVKLHYHAGPPSLKDIGAESGVSDAGILNRAKRDDWTRSLKPRVDAKVAAKVSAAVVSGSVRAQTKVSEAVIVEANANIIASAELVQRDDILLGLKMSRGLLEHPYFGRH